MRKIFLNASRGVVSLCLLMFLGVVPAQTEVAAGMAAPQYHLRFFHTHTGEHLDIIYRVGENYVPSALDELDHFLRDHRTGAIHHYDPRLFDLLHDLTAKVVSGSIM